ncbi:MAG TPA: DUF4293 domain-containing protein [Saprospiraceae bacterium]|nr:DUF4293 domain-containing protein [Saprospiraceae bacterium]MCC6688464.1 DUF4293 domain-containing protein [Saprospiraceae bacterium]HMW74939.1 DUF4293 domain-containing protein [Saprospiraceae bacterium]HMX83272.1 DUF4293 domain-containing protein [Saprospiraceae bacterium]HMX84892.1 DUF4293 domain-containing protein [Saprospiraceae bacterium]
MIQRIQSVYLVLAVIALAILFFPISFGDLKAGSTIAKTPALSDGTLNLEDNNLSMICTFAGIALFMAAIFLFKNRRLQTRIVALSMLVALIIFILAGWLFMSSSKIAGNDLSPGIGLGSPVIAILFGWLANRSIRKDENLVRSMDRLR